MAILMAAATKMSMRKSLIIEARIALQKANPTISKFHVGAAALVEGKDGVQSRTILQGWNDEIQRECARAPRGRKHRRKTRER